MSVNDEMTIRLYLYYSLIPNVKDLKHKSVIKK
jgi:hypothetical protein